MSATSTQLQRHGCFDLKSLQALLDDFSRLTDVTLVITDTNAKPITKQTLPTNRLCMELIKGKPLGKRECDDCDRRWGAEAANERTFKIYSCPHGLVDFVSPIVVAGDVLGYLFGGQVVAAPGSSGGRARVFSAKDMGLDPDKLGTFDAAVGRGEIVALPREWHIRQAKRLGISRAGYMAALDEMTVLPLEKIEASARVLHNMANSISMLIATWTKERNILAGFQQTAARLDALRETLDQVAGSAVQALDADIVHVYQYRSSTRELDPTPVRAGGRHGSGENWPALRWDGIDQAVQTGEPIFGPEFGREEIASLAAAPMRAGGEVVGVLLAGWRGKRDFAADFDLRQRIGAIADQAAVLIQNALLRQQARALKETSDEVKYALRTREIAEEILNELSAQFSFRTASLQLIRGDERALLAGRGFADSAAHRGLLLPVSQDPLIRQIVESQIPLILNDPSERATPGWKAHPATSDVRSWIGLPIVYQHEVIGLVTLDHDQPGIYQPGLKETLISFGRQVAPRIWHLRLWDSAQRLIRDHEIVAEVLQIIDSKPDVRGLLSTIASQIAERLHCSHCTIFFPEEECGHQLLKPRVTRGGRVQTMTRHFKPGEGLVGWVFENGESLITADARTDPRFAPYREKRDQPRSMLVAPIKVGPRTIGVISADQDEYGWFRESDKRLVDLLAQQAGIAIQRSAGLELLQDIGNRMISSPRVKDILENVVSGAIRLTNATTGVIYLIGEDPLSVSERFHPPDFKHPDPRLGLENGLTRTVMRTGEVLPIPVIERDTRVSEALRGCFKSMIVVPLKINEKVIGVFFVDDAQLHHFTDTEVSLLSTLAGQAAIAIQNAKLLDALKHDVDSHRALADVLKNMVVEEPAQDRALDSIGHGIRKILGDEVSPTINLYDQDTDSFGECHAYGPLAPELSKPPRSTGGTGRYVLDTREPLYLKDVTAPPEGAPSIRRESIDLGIKSFAAIPLKRQDRIVGVLFVNGQTPLDFNEEIKRVLGIFASHAGVAIEIVRLHQSAQLYGALLKAADIGYLAAGIDHEFRTALQHMEIILRQMELVEGMPEAAHAQIHRFRNEIGRTVKVMRGLSALGARRDVVEHFDLEALVKELVDVSQQRARDHGITLECANRGVEWVGMNASMVQSVIINLLRNALDAVESKTGEKRVEIELSEKGGTAVEIVVRDSGTGINPAQLNNLFLPFFTTKGSQNTGMGLFLVQSIVRDMGGKIGVDVSNSMGGATFKVSLPSSKGAVAGGAGRV